MSVIISFVAIGHCVTPIHLDYIYIFQWFMANGKNGYDPECSYVNANSDENYATEQSCGLFGTNIAGSTYNWQNKIFLASGMRNWIRMAKVINFS